LAIGGMIDVLPSAFARAGQTSSIERDGTKSTMSIPGILGMAGALIAAYAYYPQIRHLLSEHCSAGISGRAYALWFVSSILVTVNAVAIQSIVFILLGIVQIGATGIIYIFSWRYKGLVCPYHQAHPYQY
jgi:uncharacterized membrane protein YdfJ with MMPL/SSD domain